MNIHGFPEWFKRWGVVGLGQRIKYIKGHLNLYKIIFKNFDSLPSSNQIKKWGYKHKNDKINFADVASAVQKNLILNALNLLNEKHKYNIMEIGPEFGPLAERLFDENKINTLILLDIPSTLTTAFYYLSSKFGLDKVKILSSPSDVQKYYNLDDRKKILLIPTCYYDLIKNIKNVDLLCNFASFSEMEFFISFIINSITASVVNFSIPVFIEILLTSSAFVISFVWFS